MKRPKPQNRTFQIGDLVYTYVGNYPAQITKVYLLEGKYQIRYCVPGGTLVNGTVAPFEIYRAIERKSLNTEGERMEPPNELEAS